MESVRLSCRLCDILLSYPPEQTSEPVTSPPNLNYGSITSAVMPVVEDTRLKIKIWVEGDLWHDKPVYYLQLYSSSRPISDRLRIREGKESSIYVHSHFTGSSETLKRASQWLGECSQHSVCRNLASLKAFVPSRLVYVGTATNPELRLLETPRHNRGVPVSYLALSHCWGGDIDFKLTTANVQNLKQNIDINSLSKNFQDAIHITRHLGTQYLWIDSLCILQDSKDDWRRESISMGSIYAHAKCTISATASKSSRGGCFRDRGLLAAPCVLLSFKKRRLFVAPFTPSIGTLFASRVEPAPFSQRAWAFQERLLSRRILHFCSDLILYECNTMRASEIHSYIWLYTKKNYIVREGKIQTMSIATEAPAQPHDQSAQTPIDFSTVHDSDLNRVATSGIRGALDILKALATDIDLGTREALEFNQRWYELVTAYSQRALTIPTDRLVAISGIADLVRQKSKTAYIVGLWGSIGLEFGLLWKVKKPSEKQLTYCAPSWSWASVNGQVELLPDIDLTKFEDIQHKICFHAQVTQTNLTFGGEIIRESGSLVDGGYLDIKGPVVKVLFFESEPGLLSIPLNSHDPIVYTKVKFAADNIMQYPSHPDTVPLKERLELVAILILTSPSKQRPSYLRIHGLVLQRKAEVAADFLRVGVFCGDDQISRVDDVLKLIPWEVESTRIF